jgi:prepilin-type N-terminal cleavage/methylation domain-containing protein
MTEIDRGPLRRRGFTLVELLMAAALLGVLLAGVFHAFGATNERYVVVDQVTEAQQSLRGIAEMMERDIRRSGYLVPGQAAACAHDRTDAPDRLFLSDSDALRSIDELAANAPDLLAGARGVGVVAMTSTTVQVAGGATSPELQLDGGAAVGFAVGSGMILTDRDDPEARVACARIVSIANDVLTVDFGPSPYATAIGAGDVVAIPAVLYEVQPATALDPSQLLRNGLVLAHNVEDLQMVFFFDANDDALRDAASEVFGSTGAAGSYPPAPGAGFDMRTLRELELNVVTVTRDDAPGSGFMDASGNATLSQGQHTANRTVGLAAPDRRLRRIHTTSIRLRNLG